MATARYSRPKRGPRPDYRAARAARFAQASSAQPAVPAYAAAPSCPATNAERDKLLALYARLSPPQREIFLEYGRMLAALVEKDRESDWLKRQWKAASEKRDEAETALAAVRAELERGAVEGKGVRTAGEPPA